VVDLEAAGPFNLTVAPSAPSAHPGALEPVPPEPVTPEEGQPEEAVMTLVDHLSELRHRLAIAVVAVALGSVVGFFLAPYAIGILKASVPGPLRFIELGGAFFTQLKIAVVIGVGLSMPVLMWEVWGFISPGLTKEERRVARPWVPLAVLFFFIGCAVAYSILPFVTAFLLGFQIPGVLEPMITAEAYFGFLAMLFLVFGLVMEFPIVLVLLSKVGIVTSKRLASNRRFVFLGIFVFAVVATPGGDPISPAVMGSVMYVLFEVSIRLIRWMGN
jgi:sec-independent protein translocase protein TatC